jgi:alpha-L-fucosidase
MIACRVPLALSVTLLTLTAVAADPPAPHGPVPGAAQLAWHETEFYGFIHFTINTFTDKEWGYGDESPALFNPTEFDADQIVTTSKDAGMEALILTCKHHDGFCLWPSEFTEHDIAASPYQDGQGDIVREIADACARHGLKFGVYLSPWDRNHPEYGRPGYVTYFRNQLRELLTNYGDIFEVWFDGANGGDGYYGGANETRTIDRTTYYGWEETYALVRELQPGAVMFSDVGPDIRWVGNESGYAGDPCWATYTPIGRDGQPPAPGQTDYKLAEHGHRDGEFWMPAECDVSIRPGWFYHEKEDRRVRTPENLVELYYKSVGHGASFLLNLPPDRRGQIHENDVRALRGFRRILDQTFSADFTQGAVVHASNTRGDDAAYSPDNVLDGDRTTYWATDDSVLTPELVLDLGEPKTFNVVSLREYLPLGQRIDNWAIDIREGDGWKEFAAGSAIGARRLVRGDAVTTDQVRLRITKAAACPAISMLSLHREPGVGE